MHQHAEIGTERFGINQNKKGTDSMNKHNRFRNADSSIKTSTTLRSKKNYLTQL
jgi:hypothetical protein